MRCVPRPYATPPPYATTLREGRPPSPPGAARRPPSSDGAWYTVGGATERTFWCRCRSRRRS
eukprot:scaffold95922_cov61-Phaeocystis_antarctica.AAC.1